MPPLHVHPVDDETFVVLEGSLAVFLPGGQRIDLAAGEAIVAPKGVPHVYRVESDQARWLAVVTPAGFDAFVREAGEPAERAELPPPRARARPSTARRDRGCARHRAARPSRRLSGVVLGQGQSPGGARIVAGRRPAITYVRRLRRPWC